MSRGINRERQVRRLLEADDWWTMRAAGSLGEVDVIALKVGKRPLFIEVKSDVAGPFANFRPKDRADLLFAADMAGADAVLCWWPPRAKPMWIESHAWPQVKEIPA